MDSPLHFLIIIPAHNEEAYLPGSLQSLAEQSYRDFQCLIVDDGSQDNTRELAEEFRLFDNRFEVISLPQSQHQPGAKVVHAFQLGLESASEEIAYDVVCKFDADILFPPDYLERLSKTYLSDPKAGMVSGLVFIQNEKKEWVFENISSKNHVRGPIKSYRKQCLRDMGGLRPVLGWDNIDGMLAQKNGWKVVTIKDLKVKHLRPTAFRYRDEKTTKLGKYFYNIGLNLPLAALSALKVAWRERSLKVFFKIVKAYLSPNTKSVLTSEEKAFIRKLRWRQILRIQK